MDFPTFANQKPVLYGQITTGTQSKIGTFRPEWNNYSNSIHYRYYTHKGNKGAGGLTLMKAWKLLEAGRLSTNPEDGKPENYL